jgi:hypothetical protein
MLQMRAKILVLLLFTQCDHMIVGDVCRNFRVCSCSRNKTYACWRCVQKFSRL